LICRVTSGRHPPLLPLPDAPLLDDPPFADELLPDPDPAPLPVELPPLLRDELALERLPADAVFMPERLVAAEPVVPDSYRDDMPSAATVDESSRPVACRLFALWNLRRAASVCGPITPSADPALNPLSLSACCTDRMNDRSFVFAITLDDPLIELMLEDGMLELELRRRRGRRRARSASVRRGRRACRGRTACMWTPYRGPAAHIKNGSRPLR
jgi:hypothetical protein